MGGVAEEFGHDSLLWDDDDQSWAFPIFAAEENGGKTLIEGGKILTNVGNSEGQMEEAPPPVVKGKKKRNSGVAAAAASKHGGGDKGNEAAAASKHGCGDKGNEVNGGDGESDDHELHIWTERERRKKMRNMFANLHALIPNIHPRADKSTIVDESILYIKNLQQTLENLENLKKERLKGGNTNPTSCDPSVITLSNLAVQSREAFLADQGSTSNQAVTLPSPSPLFSGPEFATTFKTWTSPNVVLNICGTDAHFSICCPKKPGLLTAIFFVMNKYKLEVVTAQVSSDRCTRMYMIHARVIGGPRQFPEAQVLVEEIYKQAAAEIMLWLNS